MNCQTVDSCVIGEKKVEGTAVSRFALSAVLHRGVETNVVEATLLA